MDRIEKIKLVAEKSQQLVEKQIESYRQHRSNSGIIIGVIALFIPFFLTGLNDSFFEVKLISLIPIGFFVWALILFLQILRAQSLFQSIGVHKFQDLINKEEEEILLYGIGADNENFKDNLLITRKSARNYNRAITLTIIGILFSISLLLFNQFKQPNKIIEPTKVEILKIEK